MNATLAEQSKAECHSFEDEFRSFALANSIEMEPGYKFSREDAAERNMASDRFDSLKSSRRT